LSPIDIIYYKLLLIRRTEYKIEDLFSLGILRGTTHGCIGQEATPVALSELLNIDEDYLCGSHRSHGIAIAFTLRPELLLGEIMGKSCGFNHGLGGSQHISYKNFFTNGITGGMVPVAGGLAFALKNKSSNAIAAVCFGDGAMNEGFVLETFNLSVIMKLPILFVLENNGFAMSTAVDYASSGSFKKRIEGFGLKYKRVEAVEFNSVYDTLEEGVSYVRKERKPFFVEVLTHRFSGHSKSDKREYVPAERDAYWKDHNIFSKIEKSLSPLKIKEISEKVDVQVEEAYRICCDSL
jgi:TPP-dependent pyruvate/acetoin dehydrogenase alpha subunit